MKNLQLVIVGVITLTLISCKEEKPKNIITLIDTSGTIDSNTIEWYRESIENCIMQKMGKKDRFMVLPIDFGSQTASQELYRVDFSKNNYKMSLRDYNQMKSRHKVIQIPSKKK